MAHHSTGKRMRVAVSLAGGASVAKAAQRHGVGVRTVWAWLADPAFAKTVANLRERAVSRAVGRLSRSMVRAVDRLVLLLDSPSESVQLNAATRILQLAIAGHAQVEIERRIAELERLSEQK